MNDPVLVTGATGTIGSALVRHLVAGGRSVRAVARSEEAARTAVALGATAVRADVLDLTSLEEAARGCEVVFHVAGRSGLCLPPAAAAAMERLNVEGTANAIRAAAAAGVRRVVHTSSAATLGERRGEIGDERTVHRGSFLSRYERSKVRAERLAFDLGRRLGVEVVSVNPASVQGPGRLGGSARLLLAAASGRLPVMVRTSVSLVDVDDCAAGHALAADRGVTGERYVLSGASIVTDEAVELLLRLGARGRRPIRVPGLALVPVGALGSVAAPLLRGRTLPCREAVRTIRHGHRYDGGRATRELGLVYTSLERTLERTLAWYAERGVVPDPRRR